MGHNREAACVYFCCSLFIAAIMLFAYSPYRRPTAALRYVNATTTSRLTNSSDTALFRDCRHVFVDLGANIGVHARFLLQRDLYPLEEGTGGYQRFFDAVFAGVDRNQICVFGFEANPAHRARLAALAACYRRHARLTYFVPAAAALSDDEHGALFLRADADRSRVAWGGLVGRTLAEFGAVVGEVTPVASVNMTRFLSQMVATVPRSIHIKMDIEGGEFILLPAFEASGLLCGGVHSLTVELHGEDRFTEYRNRGQVDATRFPTYDTFVAHYGSLWKKRGNDECEKRTAISYFDTENYYTDSESPLDETCQ